MKKKIEEFSIKRFRRGGIFLLCFLLCFTAGGPLIGRNPEERAFCVFAPAWVQAKKEGAEIQDFSLEDYQKEGSISEKSPESTFDQEDREEGTKSSEEEDEDQPSQPVTESAKEDEEKTAASLKKFFTYYDQVPVMLIGTVEGSNVMMGKNADQVHGIASMTKLMTYYLAKEDLASGKASMEDEVTVSKEAADLNQAGYSNYGLKAGDKLPLSQMIYGMMTVSGNDASTAIAEHLGGSEKAFVARMNQTAKDMGLSTMHFVNASGITLEDGKYNQSSARDLYRFALKLIKKYPEVQDFTKVKQVEEKERKFSHPSTFYQYMRDIPGMKGLKTGNSKEAGHCFAGWFSIHSKLTQSDYEIIAILMGAPSNDARWRTTLEMVQTSAGSFSPLQLVDQEKPVERMEIPGSKEGWVDLYPAESFSIFTYTNAKFDIHYRIDSGITAPTKAGQRFGTISISKEGKEVKEIPIVGHESTEKAPFLSRLGEGIGRFTNFLSSLA